MVGKNRKQRTCLSALDHPRCHFRTDDHQNLFIILSLRWQPGEISRKKGYLVHEMADHARVVVARPDFAENWMFFIRKLDNIPEVSLQQLVTGGHAEIPVELLKWLMKGCQVTAVTGMQGCGKTTLLTAMVGEIPEEYTIRVLELAFELHLRERYQNRNIVTFRETAGMLEHGGIGGQEALEVQKKTDGAVSIIGEVVSAKVASWMIESGQTGSLFTIFTHHAKSTRSLLLSLRNSLLKEGSFQSERIALEQGTEEFVKALFLQVRAYQGIRIAWYHILFIVVVSILAFRIPELFLVADQWKSREKRMSECLRLQTVVLLLIHYEKTTVEEILSQMENFAVLFQSLLVHFKRFRHHLCDQLLILSLCLLLRSLRQHHKLVSWNLYLCQDLGTLYILIHRKKQYTSKKCSCKKTDLFHQKSPDISKSLQLFDLLIFLQTFCIMPPDINIK
jgi:type IV secretory pathway ATPase VirB11/archaellum biosynthesis ATPase